MCDANFEPISASSGKDVFTEGSNDEGLVPASTTVFLLEPGEMPSKLKNQK